MPAEQSPFYGTQAGSSFSLYPRNNSTVRILKVWAGLGSGKADKDIVLKGIAVERFNGERDKIYNRPQPGDTGTLHPRIANGSVIGFLGMSGWGIDHLSIRYNAK
ncbi:uncharacterized protein G6M90_00g068860 [Metarhizium brunneum]|uniref:Jacalin-type lectin domain-containing protein n=1 Tax=Metarhizium brunneum TaxID=500148 RepID=A0A7D5UZ01_9HYPO|nr:hypothetical protein G6M90_00g068860 [Metarhizium brunneum]